MAHNAYLPACHQEHRKSTRRRKRKRITCAIDPIGLHRAKRHAFLLPQDDEWLPGGPHGMQQTSSDTDSDDTGQPSSDTDSDNTEQASFDTRKRMNSDDVEQASSGTMERTDSDDMEQACSDTMQRTDSDDMEQASSGTMQRTDSDDLEQTSYDLAWVALCGYGTFRETRRWITFSPESVVSRCPPVCNKSWSRTNASRRTTIPTCPTTMSGKRCCSMPITDAVHDSDWPDRPARWLPGTLAISIIRREQECTDLTTPPGDFRAFCLELLHDMAPHIATMELEATCALQHAAEAYLVDLHNTLSSLGRLGRTTSPPRKNTSSDGSYKSCSMSVIRLHAKLRAYAFRNMVGIHWQEQEAKISMRPLPTHLYTSNR